MLPDDDLPLLRDCLDGKPGAWEAFVARFTPLVDWMARSRNPGQVEDIRQEVFLALSRDDCRRLRQFQPSRGRLAAWVGLVARQVALKALAKDAPAVSLAEAAQLQAPTPPETPETGPLRQALEALPDREALCLRLLVEQGFTVERTAAILGVSRTRVYQLRASALTRLREALKKTGNSP